MNFPTFVVHWVDPNDPTLGMDFFPPKGSDELHEALRQYYPHLNNLQARMRQASIDFLLDQDQASPASEKPTPDHLPSPPSFPSSAVASPSDAMQSAPQNSATLPKQEDLMNVWTLPSNPDAKIHKRRTMTAEEKRAYKQKRLEGACADCKRRRRKCQHGTSPAASSSSSCKPARRKARTKPSLDVSPSPSDAAFPTSSMDQCMLPEPQLIRDAAFNIFSDLPTTLGLADGTPPLPEMDFDSTLLDTDFLELNKDWDLFPDTQYDIYAPLQPPHAIDTRQYSAVNASTHGHSSFYSDSPGGLDPWIPSLDYTSSMFSSPDQLLSSQPSSSSTGTLPTASSARQPDAFHGPDSLMEISPSSSSQSSFSDTGHVPGGSNVSPLTSASSDLLTDCGDFYSTTDMNSVPGPLFKKDLNRHVSRRRNRSQEPPLQDVFFMDDFLDSSRFPRLIETVAGPLSLQHPRHQSTRHQNAAAASPLSDNWCIDSHVIGISRSKKPEHIDCREWAGSQFYALANAFADADHLREQNLDAERHRLRSAFNSVQSAFQMGPSTTTSTLSISGHVQQPDRTKDTTILSLTRAGPSQPSFPTSTPAQSFISREAPSWDCTASSRCALPCVSESESVSSSGEVGGAGYWNKALDTHCRKEVPGSIASQEAHLRLGSTFRGVVRDEPTSPSCLPLTSTRGASTHHSASAIVHAPQPTTIVSVQAVGGTDHSLFKPGHHSLIGRDRALSGIYSQGQSTGRKTLSTRRDGHFQPSLTKGHFQPSSTSFLSVISTRAAQQYLPVIHHSGDSTGTSMGWRVPSGSKLAGQHAQMCLGMVYFFALLRETPQGKKMSGMFLGAVLTAALFLLSLYGFVLR
jgi:hypothetical protein